jgi:tetratricopeptide (TPR) repeat protein
MWLRKAGKSLVVVDFADETSNEGDKPKVAAGYSSLLVVRLNRLSRIYRQVDEARPILSVAMMERNPGPAMKVEEGDLSTDIFTDDSKLALGAFSIPGKFINSLIDRLTRRPKIYGSLMKDGDREILTARMSARGRTLSWWVDGQDQLPASVVGPDQKDENAKKKTKDEMVTELACKIFTDLIFDEAKIVPWKATWHFTEGLRKYREVLNAKSGYMKMLEDSERSFLQAIQEDDDYPWAHYNLGVVYMEIAHLPGMTNGNKYLEEAGRAFRLSIERYPQYWQSYYSLAMVLYRLHKHKYVFSWDDNETLSETLREFLPKKFGCNWGTVKKIDDKTIKVSSDKVAFLIRLGDKEAILSIDDKEVGEFIAKEKNSKIDEYQLRYEFSRYNIEKLAIERTIEKALDLCSDYSGLAWIYCLRGRITGTKDIEYKKNPKSASGCFGLASYYALRSRLKAEFSGEDTEAEKYLSDLCMERFAGSDHNNKIIIEKLK